MKNRKLYLGIVLIALGIMFNTTMNNTIGIVFIAVGVLFFILGMQDKKGLERDK